MEQDLAKNRVDILDLANREDLGRVEFVEEKASGRIARVGASTNAVHARNHAAGRALARAISDIVGLLYGFRWTGEDVYAVFDRGIGKLGINESGMLVDHLALPVILTRYGFGLVA